MAENEQVMSKRARMLERLKAKSPDKAFEDDEEIFGQISDDYDKYEQDNERYKADSRAVTDLFGTDPRNAEFLADIHNGEDPIVLMIRRYGMEIKDALDDPEKQEQIAAANKEFVERLAKSKALDEEYDKNMQESLVTLREYQQENGLSDEEIDKLYAAATGNAYDIVMGKISRETIEMLRKAMNHDLDVAAAGEEGKIAGRNEKIVEKLRKAGEGDGTAPLGGKNGAGPSAGRKEKNLFDLANEAM